MLTGIVQELYYTVCMIYMYSHDVFCNICMLAQLYSS